MVDNLDMIKTAKLTPLKPLDRYTLDEFLKEAEIFFMPGIKLKMYQKPGYNFHNKMLYGPDGVPGSTKRILTPKGITLTKESGDTYVNITFNELWEESFNIDGNRVPVRYSFNDGWLYLKDKEVRGTPRYPYETVYMRYYFGN